MEKTISIKLLLPSGMSVDLDVTDDLTVSSLIDEIASHFELPLLDDYGKRLKYRIDSKSLARRLYEEETLASAKVPSGDSLIFTQEVLAGGSDVSKAERQKGKVSMSVSSVGLPLDDLTAVDTSALLSNEPALMMTLHSYRATLSQLEDSRQELKEAKGEIEQLTDRLKEKNIATVLLILGQIQIGFGTNLITNNSMGGWFVFLSGAALNLGALYISFLGTSRLKA